MTSAPTLSFRRRLPHWLVADHAYFVTLCRKGSLPVRVVKQLRAEQKDVARDVPDRACSCVAGPIGPGLLRASGGDRAQTVAREVPDRASDIAARDSRHLAECRRRFLEIDAILDAAMRSRRDLCDQKISFAILSNLDWLRARGWRIWAATLMPSHMHLVLRNFEGRNDALCNDLARFMSWTARQVNALLETDGSFWQPEPFDHWCRDADAWLRSVSYTLNNPVKAGLCTAWRNWSYTVADPEVEELIS